MLQAHSYGYEGTMNPLMENCSKTVDPLFEREDLFS